MARAPAVADSQPGKARPDPPDARASEADFQATVIELARDVLGYAVYHTYDSRGSESGWPDLVIVGHGRVFFVEVKTARGRVSAAQYAWGGLLSACGAYWRVWRPQDWPEIVRVLDVDGRIERIGA